MSITAAPALEQEKKPTTASLRFRGWLACCLLTVVIYLLPLPLPGERILLVAGLAVFWAGVIASFRSYGWRRLLPIAVALLNLFPVRTGTLRLLLLCGMMALWITALVVFRQRRGVVGALLATGGISAGFLLLPGRAPNPEALRAEYARSLQGFQGTTYIWGGENGIGIDCSGLIRCGWMDANLRTGLRTLNPGLVRQAARIWLQDCSAQELGLGYRNRTQLQGTTPALNEIDTASLQVGDLAVTQTQDWAHILAYIGDHRWIEADPGVGKVITMQTPVPNDITFNRPMKIVRWRTTE